MRGVSTPKQRCWDSAPPPSQPCAPVVSAFEVTVHGTALHCDLQSEVITRRVGMRRRLFQQRELGAVRSRKYSGALNNAANSPRLRRRNCAACLKWQPTRCQGTAWKPARVRSFLRPVPVGPRCRRAGGAIGPSRGRRRLCTDRRGWLAARTQSQRLRAGCLGPSAVARPGQQAGS